MSMPSRVPSGGGVPKERAPARYGPSASSTRPSGGCSVSYWYWPRSMSSIPAARCSGSSQVLEYTRQLPAASRQAATMISASAKGAAAAARAPGRALSLGSERVPQHDGLLAVGPG
jgi:hypothetical protein